MADTFDAITLDRPYRRALSYADARRKSRGSPDDNWILRLWTFFFRVRKMLRKKSGVKLSAGDKPEDRLHIRPSRRPQPLGPEPIGIDGSSRDLPDRREHSSPTSPPFNSPEFVHPHLLPANPARDLGNLANHMVLPLVSRFDTIEFYVYYREHSRIDPTPGGLALVNVTHG